MDGVLIDSEPLWWKAIASAFRSIGITSFKEEWGIHTMATRIDAAVKYWHNKFKWKHPPLHTVEKMIMNEVENLIISHGKIKEGAVSSLKFFHGKKLKVAIASSAHMRVIKTVVNTLKIGYYFDLLHSAEYEKHGKPAPDVYLTTARELGLIPSECLVIEDSPVGIIAAKNARMTCIAVPEKELINNNDIKKADYIISSLIEITTNFWEKINK
jgi:mannitol-1-/sugar-/sorbitol-6-/2-deoxyglucose-6-phosphatase